MVGIKYKLGLDLGSTSLGWAVVELDKNDQIIRLVDMGVRIFPDGRDEQKHTPINVERRNARGMRRRSDRLKIRKKRTLQLIKKYGLDFDIQKNPELENPYELRVKALSEKLTHAELGRVMFHLALRRGFKSNRKETRGKAGGKLKNATEKLQAELNGGTLAQFQVATKNYRFANQFDGDVIKDGALYPTRDMYLDEFNRICDAQGMSDEMRAEFHRAIFRQSKLKPVEPGKCIFETDLDRAYRYEPDFQKWRVLQQVNQLAFIENGERIPLNPEQRQLILDLCLRDFSAVNKSGVLTFAAIKKHMTAAKLIETTSCKFNLETEIRKEINVDTTALEFWKVGELEFWKSLDTGQQSDILAKVNDNHIEDDDLVEYLVAQYALSRERAEKIIEISPEDGVASVSLFVIDKMLPFLEEGMLYHEAAEKAGYKHSDKDVQELGALPYYGDLMVLRPSLVEDGNGCYRTMNATVHIAMNQIRAVVNDLILRFGKPYAINIEMGRDVRSGAKELGDMLAGQAKNKRENDKIAELLKDEWHVKPNKENILRYKLWKELSKDSGIPMCPYTGKIIGREELFSPEFEIEHILPFAQTLDDSISNKTLSAVEANRFKGNRPPYDAFTASDSPWDYAGVWKRAQCLPDSKKWRFAKGALEKFNKDAGFIARALNDTRHMSRMAVTYLKHICVDKNAVFGLPGGMTALFRDMWHLNWLKDTTDAEKYRGYHIHHAIDAFVIACMGRGNLQTLSKNAQRLDGYFGKTLKEKRKHLFAGMVLPFDGFNYVDFKMMYERTIISYRKSIKNPSDNGTVGQLHEDTAYNLEDFESGVKATMSHRVALPTTEKDKKEFDEKGKWRSVNDKTWGMFMADTGFGNDTPHIGLRFLDWCENQNPQIKKVRVQKTGVDTTTYVPIFRTKADKRAYYDAYSAWYVADGVALGIADKKQKNAHQEKEALLLAQYQNAARKAYKWYVGGNNFCAEIFEIRDDDKRYPKKRGKWQVEIVSNYNAELNKGQPMWRKKYPTARRVMTLRINDMVMAEFSKDDSKLPKGLVDAVAHQCAIENTDTVQMVFKVKKLKSSGVVYLRPHHIAKEEADTKSWAAGVTSLQEHKACKIHVSPTGKILKQL